MTPSRHIETVADLIAELRDQRDVIYTNTVDPRRNVERALQALQGHRDVPLAIDYLEDVARGLENVRLLYRDYTEVEREDA